MASPSFFYMFLSFLSLPLFLVSLFSAAYFFPFFPLHACKVQFLHCLPSCLLCLLLLFILLLADIFFCCVFTVFFSICVFVICNRSKGQREIFSTVSVWNHRPTFLLQIGFWIKIIKSNRWARLKCSQQITEAAGNRQHITTIPQLLSKTLIKKFAFPGFKGRIMFSLSLNHSFQCAYKDSEHFNLF